MCLRQPVPKVAERVVVCRVTSRNKVGGSLKLLSDLGEEVTNSRKTVPETILFFDTIFVHKCLHVLNLFYIFNFMSALCLCVL